MEKRRKKIIILALLNLGIFSLVAQIVLIRELLNSFFGNELFIGFILAAWLFSTGIGSIFLSKSIKKASNSWLLSFHILAPVVFFISFLLARAGRLFIGGHGVEPGLLAAILWLFAVILPLGLILGWLFVLLASCLKETKESAVSKAYIIESLGFLGGALFFNYILFSLPGLAVIIILGIINSIIALLFSFGLRKIFLRQLISVSLAVIIIVFGISLPFSFLFDKRAAAWRYPNQDLLISKNTRFGTVETTLINGQTNFYYNGHLLDNSQNRYHNELLAHLPLILMDGPKNALIIGNGFSGIMEEVGKHNLEKAVYLEMDREYLESARQLGFILPGFVEVINEDARVYLNKNEELFDLIIINYSNPATISENRFFTKEFFSSLAGRLSEKGIIALKLDSTPNYTIGAQNDLLACLYNTINSVFNNVLVLPDNEVVYLAGKQRLAVNSKEIEKRYSSLNLNNEYASLDYINWRLNNDRVKALNYELRNNKGSINLDFKPILYFKEINIFSEKMGVKNIAFFFFLLSILAALFVFLAFIGKAGKRAGILLVSAVPDFCLMAFEVLLVLIFLTYHGYLYTQLSMIIALVLLGIVFGSLIFSRLINKKSEKKLLTVSFAIIIFSYLISFLFVYKLNFVFYYKLSYYLLALLAGFAAGTKFPVINKIYLKKSSNLGAVYGVDLIGGSLGALLAGTFLLPVLGAATSLGVFAGLCAIIFLFFKINN